MKTYTHIFLVSLLLTLSNCATVNTGLGPHGLNHIQNTPTPAAKQNITFSVNFINEYGPAAWIKEKEVIRTIRKEMEQCGQFNRIEFTPLHYHSENHCHFNVHLSGTSMDTRLSLIPLAVLSATLVPTWMNVNLDWDLTYIQNNEICFTRSSQQSARDIVWGPAIVAAPFMNRITTGTSMIQQPVRYFMNELYHFNKKGSNKAQ